MLLAALVATPSAALARHRHVGYSHGGGTYQEMCYKNVYREQYVPGTYGRPGYVRRWNDRQRVPCYTAGSYRPYRQPTYHPRPRPHRQPVARGDNNSCLEGAILGGILGGGIGGAVSRGDGRYIGIPGGLVAGALIGCQLDGG